MAAIVHQSKMVTFADRRCREIHMRVGTRRSAASLIAPLRRHKRTGVSNIAVHNIQHENFYFSPRGYVELIQVPARLLGITHDVTGDELIEIAAPTEFTCVNDDVPALCLLQLKELAHLGLFATRRIDPGIGQGFFKLVHLREEGRVVLDKTFEPEVITPETLVVFQKRYVQTLGR